VSETEKAAKAKRKCCIANDDDDDNNNGTFKHIHSFSAKFPNISCHITISKHWMGYHPANADIRDTSNPIVSKYFQISTNVFSLFLFI
jgi:hypothetical protein